MTWLDWAVILAYAATVVGLGTWAGRREKDTTDFFLAGRSMTWFPVAVSSLATALSALTFIGLPGASYGGNFVYLQLWFGTLAGQVILATVFLPVFYKLRVTTVYQLLGERFGLGSRTAGTVFFIISRILASAVRLAGCAIAVSVFFNLPLKAAIVLIAVFALIYTTTGGIKAVIWTDMLQLGLFVTGALIALGLIWHALPEGFSQFLEIGRSHGKFETFNFGWDLSDPNTFWAGNLFAMVIGVAVGATDQDIAQRLLTCDNVRSSQRAAIVYGIACFFTALLFLSVGASLFAYYQVFPDPEAAKLVAEGRNDWIFPHFIRTAMLPGLRGLLVAALLAAAMSSLDSALNGLAATTYVDLYLPFLHRGLNTIPKEAECGGPPGSTPKGAADARGLRTSRALVLLFGVILAVVAMVFGRQPSILWFGLRIMGYTYGALLGVFLLAVLTRNRGSELGNMVAMTTSVFVVLFLTADSLPGSLGALRSGLLGPLGVSKIAWPWAIVMGTAWTFGVAALRPTARHVQAKAQG